MRHNIVVEKFFGVVAMLLIPSIMMADKIELQDSIVIVVGKGQTNKNGFFIPSSDTIRIDSIFIDEIVLSYTGRQKQVLSVVDSVLNQPLFSHDVTNSMSEKEMLKDTLSFSLLAGHKYTIKHGDKKSWGIIISDVAAETIEVPDSTNNDSIGTMPNVEGVATRTNLSWWFWLCVGIIVGAGSLYFFIRNRHRKNTVHEQKKLKSDTTTEKDILSPKAKGDEEGSEKTSSKVVVNKSDQFQFVDKEERNRLKKLKRIATMLGLKESQLNLIEFKINELQKESNQKKQISHVTPIDNNREKKPEVKGYKDIYAVHDEVAKELLRKFEQRSVFAETINKAKERCYVKEPKESEVLKYLIDEIAKTLRTLSSQIESASEKNHEPVTDTVDVVKYESHPEWLNKRLKELFDFTYDKKESVKKNLEQLILERTEKKSGNGTTENSTTNIETQTAIKEELKKAKEKWEAESKKEKADALAKKEEEIDGLKQELETKDGIISGLNGQIVNKERTICEKEQIILGKNSTINEMTQKITDRDSELQRLKDKHKQELQTKVEALVNKLNLYTEAIEWRTILDPCGNDDASMNQCTDIENRLNKKLRQMKERLCGFAIVENATPEQTRMAIQKALTMEIAIDESVVNSLCRLYAYSNLAFMTDMKREYGVRLRRKNIHEVYEAMETLYIQFGIKFLIPPLFVMESKDGDYENVTGQVYSELGNLCPNVNNHCDNIDSNMRLKDVIVDIDKVGYAIDGSVQRKARILTF